MLAQRLHTPVAAFRVPFTNSLGGNMVETGNIETERKREETEDRSKQKEKDREWADRAGG